MDKNYVEMLKKCGKQLEEEKLTIYNVGVILNKLPQVIKIRERIEKNKFI